MTWDPNKKLVQDAGMAGTTVKLADGTNYTMKGASSGTTKTPILNNATSGNVTTSVNQSGSPLTQATPTTSTVNNTAVSTNGTNLYQTSDDIIGARRSEVKSGGTTIGLSADEIVADPTEMSKLSIQNQREQKALAEAQLKRQQEMGQYNTEKQTATLAANTSAGQGIFSDSREGPSSSVNLMASSQLKNANDAQTKQLIANQTLANQAIVQAQKDLEYNQLVNNTKAAEDAADRLAAAKNAAIQANAAVDAHTESQRKQNSENLATLASIQTSGALNNADQNLINSIAQQYNIDPAIVTSYAKAATTKNATEAQKTQFDQQTKTLSTFKDLVSSGMPLSMDLINKFAAQTGLPANSLFQFNQTASAIMDDKTLSNEQKAQLIQEKGYTLDQMSQGIFTQNQQDYAFLEKLYNENASPEMIRAFQDKIGVKDDLTYQADLKLKQAQAEIESKKSRGEPITDEDKLKEAEAREKLSYLTGGTGGSSTYYVPSQPLEGITVSTDNGSYNITVPPNKEFQCAAFVNRVWGLSSGSGNQHAFGSSEGAKQKVVDDYGFKTKGLSNEELAQKVKPGMAWTMPIANNPYDHVGLVKTVLEDGIMTYEANANGRARTGSVGEGKSNVTSRFIPWNQLYGFVAPPTDKVVEKGGTTPHNQYMQEAKKLGLDYDTAKKYADTKVVSDMDPTKQNNKDFTQANQLYGRYDSTAKEIRTLEQGFAVTKGFNVNTQNPYDDQALIFSFMKVLDPGSVVREGEFKTAQNNASMLQAMAANWQNAANGTGMLLPEQRQKIIDSMKSLQSKKMGEYEVLVNQQAEAGKKLGFDDPSLFLDYTPDYFKKNKTSGQESNQLKEENWVTSAITKISSGQSNAQKALNNSGIELHPSGSSSSILSKYSIQYQ